MIKLSPAIKTIEGQALHELIQLHPITGVLIVGKINPLHLEDFGQVADALEIPLGDLELAWIPYEDISEISYEGPQSIKVVHCVYGNAEQVEHYYQAILFVGDLIQICKQQKIAIRWADK